MLNYKITNTLCQDTEQMSFGQHYDTSLIFFLPCHLLGLSL